MSLLPDPTGMNRIAATLPPVHLEVRDLTMAYGERIIQQHLHFRVHEGDIFVIMGGSGCGKSTLLRHLIGLNRPAKGQILYHGRDFCALAGPELNALRQRIGILYQSGALWSSLTLAENIALPLRHYTDLPAAIIGELVAFKLALVGLAGFEDYYPSEISGGMRKRAGLARAIALDPDILFFDEPSAGLDPVSSHLLDELIRELRDSLGATVVIVTHELDSIFAIGNNSVFLDPESRTQIAGGDPKALLEHSTDLRVRNFLTRGRAMSHGTMSHGTMPSAPERHL